ncbi:hypothetical protein [Emticicia sp. BO119]|uniref:hypothetical protein n=1 Tax=Emticicia sp. BO119 TaxID=2757768 RepID=UPI0015F0B126|nr:hypothetical protein [Emticicia sp. BO119]MBA4848986.1 hypothetical protein [Emticicia sp. BO119]
MSVTKFSVLKLDDARSHGSELELNGVYIGELDESKSLVYFTDKAEDEWFFYIGDSCELVIS